MCRKQEKHGTLTSDCGMFLCPELPLFQPREHLREEVDVPETLEPGKFLIHKYWNGGNRELEKGWSILAGDIVQRYEDYHTREHGYCEDNARIGAMWLCGRPVYCAG